MKEPMNFRIDQELAKYLRGMVKATGATMTEYIEGLIATDHAMTMDDKKNQWTNGFIVCSRVIRPFYDESTYMEELLKRLEGGEGPIAVASFSEVSESDLLQLAKWLTDDPYDICIDQDTGHIAWISIDGERFVSCLMEKYGKEFKIEF